MSGPFSLLRDTRHLQAVALGLIVLGGALLAARSHLIPKSFGEHGPYRGDALREIAAQQPVLTSDTNCLKCHESVHEERAESPHKDVACLHCHGNGHEHMAQAEKAAADSSITIEKAKPWDGDFFTKLDLFITKDRATCLSCHEKVVGMPASFRSIDVKSHLADQGAENIDSPDVCFECHTGHSPGI